jgi:hypothetical protein
MCKDFLYLVAIMDWCRWIRIFALLFRKMPWQNSVCRARSLYAAGADAVVFFSYLGYFELIARADA